MPKLKNLKSPTQNPEEFEGKIVYSYQENEYGNPSTLYWVMKTEDDKYIEFPMYFTKEGKSNKDITDETKVKIVGDNVYADGELNFTADIGNPQKYDNYKKGKIVDVSYKNGQTYITMQDEVSGNQCELVYPKEIDIPETLSGYDKDIKYTVNDGNALIEFMNSDMYFSYPLYKEVKKDLKKTLQGVRDKLAEQKQDALNPQKHDKKSINEEKSKRIKQLTPEHQEMLRERAKARNS